MAQDGNGLSYTPAMLERLTPSTERGRIVLLLAGASAGVLIHLVLLRSLDDPSFFTKYWQLAEDLLAGEISRERLNDVSPLYLWLIALSRFADLSPSVIRIVQLASTGGVIILASSVAYRLAGTSASIVTGVALFANKGVFLNASELEPESLILLLNTIGIFFLIGARRTTRTLFLAGLALGLSAVARPVVLPGALLLIIAMAGNTDLESPSRLKSLGSYVVALAIPLVAAMGITWMLTGHPSLMNPGTVFYEGMNPHATGYAATEPLIVSDVRAAIDQPDPLHQAYRLVAARATGSDSTPEVANRFWTDKALSFVREQPRLAFALTMRKAGFSIHSYDSWDIGMMIRRDRLVASLPWIPFGWLIALAIAALFEQKHDRRIIALWLFALSYVGIMSVFYVSGRQRNALVSAIAVLAGVGASHLITAIRRRPRRSIFLGGLVVIVAAALTVDGSWQRENRYSWTAAFRSEAIVERRNQAVRNGDETEAMRMRALDRTWLLGDDPHIPSAPRDLVAAIGRAELNDTESPPRLFDIALALQYAGEWSESEVVLSALDEIGYEPIRKTYAIDSLAWYRARAALHSADSRLAAEYFRQAWTEAPADPDVLAMRAILENDPASRELLFDLHDPFTARLALARALFEIGDLQTARDLSGRVASEIPEWNRAQLLHRFLDDRITDRHGAR